MKTAVSALPTRTSVAPLLVPALLACYVIWGSTYLAIRFALQGFPPFFQMASRFLVAGGLLIGWVLWRDGVAGLPTRRQWLHALVIGGLMLGGGMGLIAQAEVHISSGLIATFVAVVPMMVSAWGLLFGKRPTGLELAGMGVGLIGVIMLAHGSGVAAKPEGDALVAACGKYNLEHCNTITNSAGRRVWGFMGIEAVARPHINEFTDASQCTYVPEDWRD